MNEKIEKKQDISFEKAKEKIIMWLQWDSEEIPCSNVEDYWNFIQKDLEKFYQSEKMTVMEFVFVVRF